MSLICVWLRTSRNLQSLESLLHRSKLQQCAETAFKVAVFIGLAAQRRKKNTCVMIYFGKIQHGEGMNEWIFTFPPNCQSCVGWSIVVLIFPFHSQNDAVQSDWVKWQESWSRVVFMMIRRNGKKGVGVTYLFPHFKNPGKVACALWVQIHKPKECPQSEVWK